MKNVNGDKLTTFRTRDFQNLAHLRTLDGGLPNSRRGVGEVTVTRKTQLERNGSDVRIIPCQPFQRCAQSKLREVAMDGHAQSEG